MYIELSTAGQQVIMDAATQGYKLTLGKAALFRTPQAEDSLPYPLTLAEVDSNILNTWTKVADNLTAIDEYNPVSPEIFQVTVNVPFSLGDFEFDAIALYLEDGSLLGVGCYSHLYNKLKASLTVESNKIELDIFIRHASIAGVMNVTRNVALRPYSYMTEYANTDLLGKASENAERIYRITRATDALNDGKNQFTTFFAHAGIAFFDGQNKPYQKEVWVPSDHMSMFGHDTLRARIINSNSVSVFVPKNTFPMIEHIVAEVPYLLATTQYGASPIPAPLQGGLLLESALSTRIDTDPNFYEFVFQLLHTTFNTGLNQDFGINLYALNTDLAAQTAIKIALKRFLEMQYDIGRMYKSDQSTDPNLVLKPFLGYDTYWRKLDGVVEVATSTTDGRIASPGQLYDLPDYATGGETLLAPVLRATNMWLRYDPSSSGTITYQLGTDRTTVNEGGTINVTLLTTGLANGSLVAYTITGIQQEDLSSGTLTGFFTVSNNSAHLAFGIAADNLSEGPETFTISIDADPTVKASVLINDTSITVDINSFYAMDPNAAPTAAITSINEGQSCYYISVVTGIADGTFLYPRISDTGSANAADLSQSIPNSVRVTNGRVSFPINVLADKTSEGEEQLIIGLYKAATIVPENLLSLKSITINDTSVTPTINCYFYTDTSSTNPVPVSQVNEGQYVYLNILTTGYATGTILYLNYPTNVDRPVSPEDFATARPTTATVNAQGRATVAYFLANDNATEEYPGGFDTETFAVQIKDFPTSQTILAQAQVLVKDTSKLNSGAFTIVDITDPLNPVPFFSSESEQLSSVSDPAASGGGLHNKFMIAGSIYPLDVCLMLGHKYRLIWIQSETATSSVTRAAVDIYSGQNYGVGLGVVDTNSDTSGKALSMINDGNGNVLGYGAIFEFTITKVGLDAGLPISMPFIINVYTYYPNGVPGFSSGSSSISDRWTIAKSSMINHKENNDTAKIKNLYISSSADWTSFCAKEITIPFGSIADFFIVLPSGSGATSSLASSGTGNDGVHGHDIDIKFPKYLGKDGMKDNVPIIVPTYENLYFDLFNALGGDGGKGQLFSEGRTDLGGTARSTITIDAEAVDNVDELITSPTKGLFGKDSNRAFDFDVIFEVLQVIDGKSWQLGKSTNDDHGGGLGILPSGLANSAGNYRGAGGKGGDTVGTGTGYGGGASSGAIVHIRLGTRVNTAGFSPVSTLAPVSFFVSDKTTVNAVEAAGQNAVPTGLRSFDKATTPALSGANNGADGSEFYIAQMSYELDAKSALEKETLIGSGTPICFVRPTHNVATFPTLPVRSVLDWDKEQLNQVSIPKLSISRLVINATGVEGSYVDGSSATVDGLPSKATNAITNATVDPAALSGETVGNTFVYFAGANANTDGAIPVIDSTKLSTYQNLMVSNYRASNGTDAVANGDNTYSRGGFLDMYVTNFNTKSGSLFVELPRVDLSSDNPLRVTDTDNYLPDTWWSDTRDADGNSISSHNYMLAAGDGALSVQPYVLSSIVSLRPWINYGMKDATMTDKNAPIILQQGQAVTLTVVGGGGAVSTRDPDGGVTTPDPAFKGSNLVLQVKGLTNNTYTTFLTCVGGTGSIDNSTAPSPATVATYNATPLNGLLTVVGTPTLLDGASNPIKATHGGDGSGSYAKITLMNHNATPVTIQATGGKGGSGSSSLQVSDGIVIVDVV